MDWVRKQGSLNPKMTSLLSADAHAEVSSNTIIGQRSLLDGGVGIETLLSHPSSPFDNIDLNFLADIQQDTLDDLRQGQSLVDLIDKHPDDVLTVLGEMAVAKFGTFTAKDSHVLQAFGNFPMLTSGSESADDPFWEENWKQIIEKRAKKASSSHPCSIGWEQKVTLGAYVVSFKDIAKRENGDLIKLLLEKSSAGAASKDIWEFPVVRAVINYHWEHWAKRLYSLIFYIFLVWTVAFGCYLVVYIETRFGHDSSADQVSESAQQGNPMEAFERDIFFSNEPSGTDSNGRQYGSFSSHAQTTVATHVFNLICFGCMLPFGIEEYYTMLVQGPAKLP